MKWMLFLMVACQQIVKGAWLTIYQTFKFKGARSAEMIQCQLTTTRPIEQLAICMAITLSPGTIVCRKEGASLHVLTYREMEPNPHLVFDRIFEKKENVK